ncbi:Pimeloyl-ACP methyl ester carboxylesterase [Variovorax sp. HW608]|uniref:alpha/beta fold hydrolase n=1 Tax=Variovorax sp. HW608 TaxID=1034889 RepID=UPI00081F8A47|nr:alpha/beta hydrolase [Variovorax sp. HW608]SCK09850.1 Pimeloyl-ACP methyl ester carboxylesterase [Variovorax sp. HW608]
MPFADSRGRQIYYERHGEGRAVLFCHGAGSNAATWWQQLPVFSRHYTCITMDIRCFGRSAAPIEEFVLENFVEDVTRILDKEKLDKVSLVGQSLGGMIGLKLALTHPDRLAAFIGCDTSLAINHPVLLEILAARRISQRAVAIEQRSMGRWFLENHPDKAGLYAQINHFNPSTHSISADRWDAAIGSLMQPDRLVPMEALGQVQCPTLMLVGSEDPIVPVAVAREVVPLVPGAELVVVDDAGHSTYFEKPVEFNQKVLEFIARRAIY